jgi:hypothetical protein
MPDSLHRNFEGDAYSSVPTLLLMSQTPVVVQALPGTNWPSVYPTQTYIEPLLSAPPTKPTPVAFICQFPLDTRLNPDATVPVTEVVAVGRADTVVEAELEAVALRVAEFEAVEDALGEDERETVLDGDALAVADAELDAVGELDELWLDDVVMDAVTLGVADGA